MTTRTKAATAEEIAAIEDLIGNLEKRLRRQGNEQGAKYREPRPRLAISAMRRCSAS